MIVFSASSKFEALSPVVAPVSNWGGGGGGGGGAKGARKKFRGGKKVKNESKAHNKLIFCHFNAEILKFGVI